MKPTLFRMQMFCADLTAVGRALRRAARVARTTAKVHGTPIYISRNGKVIAVQP